MLPRLPGLPRVASGSSASRKTIESVHPYGTSGKKFEQGRRCEAKEGQALSICTKNLSLICNTSLRDPPVFLIRSVKEKRREKPFDGFLLKVNKAPWIITAPGNKNKRNTAVN